MEKIETGNHPKAPRTPISAGFADLAATMPGRPDPGQKVLHQRRSYIEHVTAAPISLWEQDFSRVREWLVQRDAAGVDDFRSFFHEHPEEVIGLSGSIRSRAVSPAGLVAFRYCAEAQPEGNICLVTDKDSYTLLLEQLVALAEGRLGVAGEPITHVLQETGKTLLVRMAAIPGCEQKLDRVSTAVIDISSSVNIQQTVASSAERYRRLFESAGVAMLVADAATGIIVEANKQAEVLLELPFSVVVGAPLAKILPLVGTGFSGGTRPDRGQTFINRQRSREKVAVEVITSTFTSNGSNFVLGIVCEGQHRAWEAESESGGSPCRLTAREKEILRMIASGSTSREIAERLGLSPKTVETHRSRSMRKLHIHNTAALVKHVLFTGLD